MTVKIDTTARIEKVRFQPQGAFPAGDPESGYGWLYFVTGTANGGMYFENDAGMRIGPFITGSAALGAGAITQLADTTLGGTATSVNFASISSAYTTLVFEGHLRTDRVANADAVYIRFNGATGTSYTYGRAQFSGAATAHAESTGTDSPQISFFVPGANAPANNFCVFRLTIYNYANTSYNKTALFTGAATINTTSGNFYTGLGNVTWASTAAINRVEFFPVNGPNFIAGTRITLYGVT